MFRPQGGKRAPGSGLQIVLDPLARIPGLKLHELESAAARVSFEQMKLPAEEIPLASVEDRVVPGPLGASIAWIRTTAREGRSRGHVDSI